MEKSLQTPNITLEDRSFKIFKMFEIILYVFLYSHKIITIIDEKKKYCKQIINHDYKNH